MIQITQIDTYGKEFVLHVVFIDQAELTTDEDIQKLREKMESEIQENYPDSLEVENSVIEPTDEWHKTVLVTVREKITGAIQDIAEEYGLEITNKAD